MGRPLPRRLLLAGLLALAACGPSPTAGTPAVPPVAAAPGRASLGTYTLSVTGATTGAPRASVQPSGLTGQEVGGLTFEPLSFGTFTDERTRVRHLRATFRVTNNSGAALAAPAYVPVDTDGPGGTTGDTPFKNVRFFDGSDASARAGDLSVETAQRVNSATGAVEADPDATPLTQGLNIGDLVVSLPAGQTLAGVSHRGWTAGALPAGGTGVVTFATRLPMAATPAGDPFAFDLVFSVADNPGTLNLTNIAEVEGSTPSGDAPSPLAGSTRTVEGVVTALRSSFSSATRAAFVDGFFVQEEGIDADRDPTTSDGLFVFCGADCPALTPGDRVRVTGTVGETTTVTQIAAGGAGTVKLPQGVTLPAPRTVTLPLPVGERERYEGMRLTVSGVVTNNFPLGRGASFDIADARLPTFTQVNPPSREGLAAFAASLPNRTLRIDDGSRVQNPDPVIFARNGGPLSAARTLRGGDAVTATGVLTYGNDGWTGSGSLDTYRLYAPGAEITGPERPAAPEAVGGTLRVGSMNVLNYFTTLVTTNEGCTPNGVSSAARGANTCAEFERQRTKIVRAITGLNPDVLGILEMQNDFARAGNSSVANLVGALNAATAPGTFAYIDPGANVGTDAISVAMIYKPAAVTPVGRLGVLDNTFDPNYTDSCNRPTLAQTFQSAANGGRFTAVMAHLKSKGSVCAALNDADRGDGEGNGYQARLNAARAIVNWLNTSPTGVEEPDRVIFGDLNAYREEAPVQALVSGGYANLFGPESYSYQFDGQWGSLDHALASESMGAQVTGRTKWHINSDEPTVLDYNLEFKTAGQQSGYYAADPFRSSDHDPVLVGLNLTAQAPLTPTPPAASVSLTPDTADLTATAGGPGVTQSFTANAQNVPGPLAVSVTPQNGAPALATAPATAASGASFDVTVTAPTGTAPGTYTYAVAVSGGGASDTSTLTVTVRPVPATGTGTLVISQLYGGGGNSGAPLRSDFVELFNRGSGPVSTAGLSLQYASSTGAFSSGNTFALPAATVPVGGYFLVKLADGANTAAPALPTPDASGALALSATGGKLALVANVEAISGSTDSDVLDFVGFGTAANDREGGANAPAPSNTTADLRLGGGCQDTGQNGSDFVTGAPAPRSSASPANVCAP